MSGETWNPDPAKDDLGRRVAALPGFAWVEGIYWIGIDRGPARTEVEGRIGATAQTPSCLRMYDDVRPVIDDAATGGVLFAMVPPEHRWLIQFNDDGSVCCYLPSSRGDDPIDCDSIGHAAAAVLVDCGSCQPVPPAYGDGIASGRENG